jgi:hypothetical protein
MGPAAAGRQGVEQADPSSPERQGMSRQGRTGFLAAVAGVAAVALLAGCGSDGTAAGGGGEPAAVSQIEVVAGGEGEAAYAFNLPGRVPPGPTRISLVNNGDEPHHAQLFKLKRGASADDLAGAFAGGDPAAALRHGTPEGGTGLVGPGGTSRADAIVDLTEGRHVVICLVEGPDGVPHLHEGAGVRQVRDALAARTPPPATFAGGVQVIPPRAAQRLRLDLEPGAYVLFCAVPSPDRTPHYAKGMIKQVTVT